MTRSGGALVKNVTGYELSRLWCGSRGSLCLVLEASLRLWPLPQVECLVRARPGDWTGALAFARELHGSSLRPQGVGLVGSPQGGPELRIALGARAEVVEEELAWLEDRLGPLDLERGQDPHRGLREPWPEPAPLVAHATTRPSQLADLLDAVAREVARLGLEASLFVEPLLARLELRLERDEPEAALASARPWRARVQGSHGGVGDRSWTRRAETRLGPPRSWWPRCNAASTPRGSSRDESRARRTRARRGRPGRLRPHPGLHPLRPVPADLPDLPPDRQRGLQPARAHPPDALSSRGRARGDPRAGGGDGLLPSVPPLRERLPGGRALRRDDGDDTRRAGRPAPAALAEAAGGVAGLSRAPALAHAAVALRRRAALPAAHAPRPSLRPPAAPAPHRPRRPTTPGARAHPRARCGPRGPLRPGGLRGLTALPPGHPRDDRQPGRARARGARAQGRGLLRLAAGAQRRPGGRPGAGARGPDRLRRGRGARGDQLRGLRLAPQGVRPAVRRGRPRARAGRAVGRARARLLRGGGARARRPRGEHGGADSAPRLGRSVPPVPRTGRPRPAARDPRSAAGRRAGRARGERVLLRLGRDLGPGPTAGGRRALRREARRPRAHGSRHAGDRQPRLPAAVVQRLAAAGSPARVVHLAELVREAQRQAGELSPPGPLPPTA